MSRVRLYFSVWWPSDGASDHVNPKGSKGCHPTVWSSDNVTGNLEFGISTHKHIWQWLDRINNQMDRERSQQSLTCCLILDANPVRHGLILAPLRPRWGYVGNAFGIMGTVACSAHVTCPFTFDGVWLHLDACFFVVGLHQYYLWMCICVFLPYPVSIFHSVIILLFSTSQSSKDQVEPGISIKDSMRVYVYDVEEDALPGYASVEAQGMVQVDIMIQLVFFTLHIIWTNKVGQTKTSG